MGTILDFERIGILLNSFSVISGFCADMLDRNYFGQCIHFGGLYPFCELVHSTAEGYRRCLASDRGGCTSARLCGQDYYVYRCHIGLTEMCFPVVYNGERRPAGSRRAGDAFLHRNHHRQIHPDPGRPDLGAD